MNKLYYLGVAILAAILLVSCSDDDSSTNPDDDTTEKFEFPLNRGNEWVYEEVFYDNDGVEGDKSGNERSVTVGETVTLFGKDSYMITTNIIYAAAGGAVAAKKYAYVDDKGYYEYDSRFFDKLEEADPEVEREWIKLFGIGQESWTAYSYSKPVSVQDSHEVNEANINVKYEGKKEMTSVDSTTITVDIYTVTTYYHIDTPENTYTESSTRTYYIHKDYGIISDREVQTGGNGAWGWKLKNKNF